MIAQPHVNEISWEEFASNLPRTLSDSERLLAAIYFRSTYESNNTSDVAVIQRDYFRRARWHQPSNLAATANHCAGKGWLSEAGRDDKRKLWRITNKGSSHIFSAVTTM